MLLELPKYAGSDCPFNTVKSLLRKPKSLPILSNSPVKSDVISSKKSKRKLKLEETTEKSLSSKSNRKSIGRTQSASTTDSSYDDREERNRPKPSVQIIQTTKEAKRNFEALSDGRCTLMACRFDLAEEQDEILSNVNLLEETFNSEIRNEGPKTEYKLDCYTQVATRSWQSDWKEFEASIKKEVDIIERNLERNEIEFIVKYANEILKKLNAFSASIKLRYPYRARLYYCIAKTHLANGRCKECFECSSEILRIGSIICDNKIILAAYSIQCEMHTKHRQYGRAADTWVNIIGMEENLLERAKLYHRIGKRFYELAEWEIAKSFGERCLKKARKVSNSDLCKTAFVLIGESALKLHSYSEAMHALGRARRYKELVESGKTPGPDTAHFNTQLTVSV